MSGWFGALRARWWMGLLGLCLVSCGGGGGGGDGGGSGYAVTFDPSVLSANLQAGTSSTLTVRATATNPGVFSGTLYVFVVDPSRVLTGTVNLSTISGSSMAATVYTSATLGQGRHQGTFQVQLCQDSACARQYAGSPVPLSYDFNVAPAPLSAAAATTPNQTVHQGGAVATTTQVFVGGPGLSWTASASASWLVVNNASGTGPGSFTVGYAPAGLPIALHAASVTVRASDGQTVALPFTMQVLPVEFALTSGVPTFSAVNGAPIAPQNLGFELNNGVPSPWTASGAAPWMLVSALSGTTPALIQLQPDPSRSRLASGAYTSDLVLSSPGVPERSVSSTLNLTLPTLSAPSAVLNLGGTNGRDIAPANVALSLNTGARAWPWTMSSLPAWLTSPATTGNVNQSGTTVSIAANPDGVSAGSVSATVTLSATVNGDTVTLPLTVNLNADQRRLLVSDWGVGLVATPSGTVLSRSITVRDSFGASLPWTAVSDSPWLSVTASGNTGAGTTATLQADPAALSNETLSVATVTLSSPVSGTSPAVVRVALWKSATGRTLTQMFPLAYTNLVADRIRPYVYAHNDGTTIDVYHVYTGARVDTINVGSAQLSRMAVSADGSRLYVTERLARGVAVIDLATRTRIATWELGGQPDADAQLLSMRPNGVEVVMLSGGRTFAADGRVLAATGIGGLLTASADGRRLYVQDTVAAPTVFDAYDVDYSAISGGVLMIRHRLHAGSTDSGSYGRDIAVSPDGTRLYAGVAPPYECVRLDTETLRFVGNGLPGVTPVYVNNVEVAADGRVICASVGSDDNNTIEVFAVDGGLLQTHNSRVTGRRLRNSQMVVSADGMVVVAPLEPSGILFVPIAP